MPCGPQASPRACAAAITVTVPTRDCAGAATVTGPRVTVRVRLSGRRLSQSLQNRWSESQAVRRRGDSASESQASGSELGRLGRPQARAESRSGTVTVPGPVTGAAGLRVGPRAGPPTRRGDGLSESARVSPARGGCPSPGAWVPPLASRPGGQDRRSEPWPAGN